jgi:tRNA(Ile)-lysidine synthase TilS/MesJ
MKICQNCVLPETFPGIRFNEQGICNYCLDFRGEENLEARKLRFRNKFEGLVKEHKGKAAYDAMMSYSGGKDSTYILAMLREKYDFTTLALTMDNGFLPEQTLENIRLVVEKLGVDHIFFKPRFDVLKKAFLYCAKENIYPPTTLTRASTICTTCMTLVKFATLRIALEKSIPFIIFGWSPGQIPIASSIMKNNAEMLRSTQKAVLEPLHRVLGAEIRPYFLEEKHFSGDYEFPYNISPFAFLDYDENEILKKVKTLGWKLPLDVDANSTNCLLNSFANAVHKEQHGFHPYAFEMAKLVREKHLDRATALKKLDEMGKTEVLLEVKKRLGL